ncbi:MAG: undecaprenyldiphospho-muramoylpentapeptide beta-N-acetylglucosaminyltransferase [bacterium]|nr:undecaprenyldiphospho-muramoylpentapeptide beta-N-acetylglucosaminyltransferase [bacterium]
MRIIITGGGTLGHIYPGLAIAEKLRDKKDCQKAEILFIGTTAKIEKEVIQKQGFDFKGIDVAGWTGKKGMWKFMSKLIVGVFLGIRYIIKFRPDVVIGMGGFASVPTVLAAVLFRIPTLIHEQNTIPGKATRLLAKLVDNVAISFQDSISYLSAKKIELTGNPIRGQMGNIPKQEAKASLGLDTDKFTLLIFGGSKGAHKINEVMTQTIRLLPPDEIQIIWATGEADYAGIKELTQKLPIKTVVSKFFFEMALCYAAGDLVICRAGATTLAEIITCHLPAILIPYPYATDNHQEYNAKLLAEKGVAMMFRESEIAVEKLTKSILELAQNRNKLNTMARNYQSLMTTDATQNVINLIYSLYTYRKGRRLKTED